MDDQSLNKSNTPENMQTMVRDELLTRIPLESPKMLTGNLQLSIEDFVL